MKTQDILSPLLPITPSAAPAGGGFRLRYGVAGALSPDGDPGGSALPTPPAPEDDIPDTLPKAEVTRLMQERLRRQEAAILKRAGVNSIEELEQKAAKARELEAAAAEAERKRLEEAGQYRELYDKTRAEKDAEIARLQGDIKKREEAERNARLDAQIERAAAKSTSPAQVALLLKSEGVIRYDESGAVYVATPEGKRATDGKGNPMTLEAAVDAWLVRNPHFQKASSAQGGGTPTGGGRVVGNTSKLDEGEEEFDPARRHDPDHIRRARKSIMRLQEQRMKGSK